MILKLFWKLYPRTLDITEPYKQPFLRGDGYGFFFGTRNKKEFFLSLLSQFQSDVSITIEADTVRTDIDRGKTDHTFRFIFPLGKEYWTRPVSNAPEYFMKPINRWISTHPPASDVWNNLEETAIRAINWIAGYHFFSDSQSMTVQFLHRLFRTIFIHGSWLERSNVQNKHGSDIEKLIVLTAQQIVGAMFFNHRAGRRWQNRGIQTIDELILQYKIDPGNERFYKFLELFTLSFIASKNLKLYRRSGVQEKLHSMYKTAAAMKNENTRKEERIVFHYRIKEEVPVRERLLPVGAVLFEDQFIKQKTGQFSEDALWLLGAEGFELYRSGGL